MEHTDTRQWAEEPQEVFSDPLEEYLKSLEHRVDTAWEFYSLAPEADAPRLRAEAERLEAHLKREALAIHGVECPVCDAGLVVVDVHRPCGWYAPEAHFETCQLCDGEGVVMPDVREAWYDEAPYSAAVLRGLDPTFLPLSLHRRSTS